jgi:alkylhydroperoxidase/carboxymuconolactone decarboxylase family protein YurZ
MRKTTGLILTLTAAAALGFATLVQTASAQEAAAEATYRDIDCIYFHTAAAKVNGATDEEIRETVAMAAMVRHWSTVLNGMEVDLAGFRKETDTVLKLAGEKARQASK